MPQNYTPEFKKNNVRLHLEEERTMKSITAEFGVSKASISKWCREFSEECHKQAKANPGNKTELELMLFVPRFGLPSAMTDFLKEALIKCAYGAWRNFSAESALQKLDIHKVCLHFCAFF